jgi:hypothetical protein
MRKRKTYLRPLGLFSVVVPILVVVVVLSLSLLGSSSSLSAVFPVVLVILPQLVVPHLPSSSFLILVVVVIFVVPSSSHCRRLSLCLCLVPIWRVLVAVVLVVVVVTVIVIRCCCCCCRRCHPGVLALSISIAPCFHPTSSCSWWRLGVLFVPFIVIHIHPVSRGSQRWWGGAVNGIIS